MNKNIWIGVVLVGILLGCTNADSCASCTSRTNPACVTNSSYVSRQECPESNLGCYVRIVDGHTVRGCMADLDEETRSNCQNDTFPMCQRCINIVGRPVCNDFIFPHLRLNCFQCDGNLNSECAEKMELSTSACLLYQEMDRCYIWRTEKQIKRGCLSSSNLFCTTLENCFLCDGYGCNNLDRYDNRIPIAPGSAAVLKSTAILVPMGVWIIHKLARF